MSAGALRLHSLRAVAGTVCLAFAAAVTVLPSLHLLDHRQDHIHVGDAILYVGAAHEGHGPPQWDEDGAAHAHASADVHAHPHAHQHAGDHVHAGDGEQGTADVALLAVGDAAPAPGEWLTSETVPGALSPAEIDARSPDFQHGRGSLAHCGAAVLAATVVVWGVPPLRIAEVTFPPPPSADALPPRSSPRVTRGPPAARSG